MRLLYSTIITVERRCGPETQRVGIWHSSCEVALTMAQGFSLVSWNVHRPRSDKRQNAAELSIGPCALVSKDTLLIGTVQDAGKSQESRGVSHGSQPANNSDRLNIGDPYQWLSGGRDRACRAWQGVAKGSPCWSSFLGGAERSIA